jgi:polyisoprenoid-binding protein YceI
LEIPSMTISIRHAIILGATLAGSLSAAIPPTLAAKKSVAAPPPVVASPPATGQVYTIDDAHSFVEFSVRLVGFNRVRGSFPQYEAHVYYDSAAVEHSSVSVRISVEGVDTHEAERDHHLESPDFFDAKSFPFIRFDSRSIRPATGGLIADGDLTIRDVTKPTTIPFDITTPLGTDPFGNPRFSAAGRIAPASRRGSSRWPPASKPGRRRKTSRPRTSAGPTWMQTFRPGALEPLETHRPCQGMSLGRPR